MLVLFLKDFCGKRKEEMFGVPKGVLPWKIEIGIKEITTWVTLPRDFTKNCFKNVFNKDIEMSSIMFLNMLYRHEKVLKINLA
jgi:hypothetical protein